MSASRLGVACAVSAALLGSSLLLAPAALADTSATSATTTTPTAVTAGDVDFSDVRTVGTASVTIAFTAFTTKAVEVDAANGGTWFASRYEVKATDGQTVVFDRKEGAWHADATVEALGLKSTFASDARLKRFLRSIDFVSERHAKRFAVEVAAQEAAQAKVTAALTAEEGVVTTWLAANPSATDLTGLTGGTSITSGRLHTTVTGTPSAYTIRVHHLGVHHVTATYSSATGATTHSKDWIADYGATVTAS